MAKGFSPKAKGFSPRTKVFIPTAKDVPAKPRALTDNLAYEKLQPGMILHMPRPAGKLENNPDFQGFRPGEFDHYIVVRRILENRWVEVSTVTSLNRVPLAQKYADGRKRAIHMPIEHDAFHGPQKKQYNPGEVEPLRWDSSDTLPLASYVRLDVVRKIKQEYLMWCKGPDNTVEDLSLGPDFIERVVKMPVPESPFEPGQRSTNTLEPLRSRGFHYPQPANMDAVYYPQVCFPVGYYLPVQLYWQGGYDSYSR